MTHYFVQTDYTAEIWQAMVKPQRPLERARRLVESLSGHYEQLWCAPCNGKVIGIV